MHRHYAEGSFIHVVGFADLALGIGWIEYVIPAARALLSTPSGTTPIQLEIQDAAKRTLHVAHVDPGFTSRPPGHSQSLMIQEDLPYVPGMTSIVLKIHGEAVDLAGAPDNPTGRVLSTPAWVSGPDNQAP